MKRCKFIVMLLVLLIACLCVFAERETKYATSSTASDPAVNFGAGTALSTVELVSFSCDSRLGTLSFYSRPAALSKFAPTSTPTNNQSVIYITNTGIVVTNSDTVIYQHVDGTLDYRTISSATSTNVTLSSGLSQAGSAGDYLYEIAVQGQIVVGGTTTGPGTNSVDTITGPVFVTPVGNSPVRAVLSSETNTALSVTLDK